jgi:uncharacterized protein YbjT (DUF2867 family)
MRIVVLGGRGLIGDRLVSALRHSDHEIVAASRKTGVDVVSGAGLDAVLLGASVVVDVTDTKAIDERAQAFFETSARNIAAACVRARVRHLIALSVVGADRLRDSAYFRGKAKQEALIRASALPFTIVRSTQFFELIERIVRHSVEGDDVRVPRALLQPIASSDVADMLRGVVLGAPGSNVIELAGPEQICLNELARLILSAREIPRQVLVSADARYFGAALSFEALLPSEGARIGETLLSEWLRQRITAD